MDDTRRLEAKGLARAKIRAKRRRVSSIRKRTIRGSLALFAIAWATVFGQLLTGNDPVLGRGYPTTRKPIASRDRRRPAQSAPAEPAPEVEVEPAREAQLESSPEGEFPAEPESAPEPEPIVTSSS